MKERGFGGIGETAERFTARNSRHWHMDVVRKLRLKIGSLSVLEISQQPVHRGDERGVLKNVMVLVTEPPRQSSSGRDADGLSGLDALNRAHVEASRGRNRLLGPVRRFPDTLRPKSKERGFEGGHRCL